MSEDSRLKIESIHGATVAGFKDASILDSATIQRIATELYALVESDASAPIVLDFNEVRFLSSQALGVLLTLRKRADAKGVKIALARLRPDLQRVFKITSLDKLFKFFDSCEAAAASIS